MQSPAFDARRYKRPTNVLEIGAVLLDKNDPSKVLARSREPLVRPEPSEREGYVPNVVYTCGALRRWLSAPWREPRWRGRCYLSGGLPWIGGMTS